MCGRTERSWDEEREDYACRDGIAIRVPRRSANVRDLNETKTVPRNVVLYKPNERETRITISGLKYDRDMTKIFGGPKGVKTMICPKTIRAVRQGAFCKIKSLRSIVLNEGLEALGAEEQLLGEDAFFGTF